jgi:hypothetical protein
MILLTNGEFLTALVFVIVIIAFLIGHVVNKMTNHLNIKSHGWPPPHLDASGDAISYEKEEEEE